MSAPAIGTSPTPSAATRLTVDSYDHAGSRSLSIVDQIKSLASFLFLNSLRFALCYSNSTIFGLGFVIGCIWEGPVHRVADKVYHIFKTIFWTNWDVVNATKLVVLGLFAPTATVLAGSVFFGATWGSEFTHSVLHS